MNYELKYGGMFLRVTLVGGMCAFLTAVTWYVYDYPVYMLRPDADGLDVYIIGTCICTMVMTSGGIFLGALCAPCAIWLLAKKESRVIMPVLLVSELVVVNVLLYVPLSSSGVPVSHVMAVFGGFVGAHVCVLILYYCLPDTIFPIGCCNRCGYDLTGNESGACPECGQSVWVNPVDEVITS